MAIVPSSRHLESAATLGISLNTFRLYVKPTRSASAVFLEQAQHWGTSFLGIDGLRPLPIDLLFMD